MAVHRFIHSDGNSWHVAISNSGGAANNLVMTATVPTSTVYLPGSSAPGPEIARGRIENEEQLVWDVPTLDANSQLTLVECPFNF